MTGASADRPTAHIVGGGLAGLTAALRLAEAGLKTIVHEAAPRCGGRCRSFWDEKLSAFIDNGNHLMMSGNRSIMALLDSTGASDQLVGPARAVYPFADLANGRRYSVRLNDGPLPLWAFDPKRSVPGAGLLDYAEGLKLALAPAHATVADVVRRRGALWRGFWEPLAIAALNTAPEHGQARLLWTVLAETFVRGGSHARPLMARVGLADALVDPTIAAIEARGGEIRTGARVKALKLANEHVAGLAIGETEVRLAARDMVVIALPPARARDLLPHLATPDEGEPIVNLHYRLSAPPPPLPEGAVALGLLGSETHWIFVRDAIVSLTLSAAGPAAQEHDETLAERLWLETRAALGLAPDAHYEAVRVIKERRATFDQSPASVARRQGVGAAGLGNVAIAGDWTATGLPATIESAVRSGDAAARFLLSRTNS